MAKPMKKYLVTYHMTAAAQKKAERMRKEAGPELMQQTMQAWMAWAEKCGDALVEMGAPLANGQRITAEGVGPAKKNITGYSIVQAKSPAGAKKYFRKHPHLTWTDSGCDIEINEMQSM